MSSETLQPAPGPARRTVIAAVGAVGVAATLTACSDSGDDSGSSDVAPGGEAGGAGAGAAGDAVAKTGDIPQGGGKVFADLGLVVVQPTAGEFKAYSSKCPHQGCAVKDISDGLINCPCHNSQFRVEDGSVKTGPATSGLPEAKITVNGDSITLG
ncbi:Rieske (2Fe-2S) protein [Streptomyces fructofermentans]|uniref:Cytochrome bc1 complex Rieske iron-sulfur subunit n=1 Tax=Streptomyces fructofermentans TaxID=152141 RepID=A0A918KLH7_9ACTN|nr:Rieske (2Fe-2S) protein [Streptomyces fructofermentans]GGX67603.1 iron-sulfur protein [Streptomyces fructofermentans]